MKFKANSRLVLPDDSRFLTVEDIVKMLYLASGWIGALQILNKQAMVNTLETIALKIHDHPEYGVVYPFKTITAIYKFKDKKQQIETAIKFLDDIIKSSYKYETSHMDIGNDLLSMYETAIKYDNLANLNTNSSILPIAEKAIKSGLTEEDIEDILKDLVVAKPGSIHIPANVVVDSHSVGEIEIQLSGLYGKINGKETTDMWEALTKDLTEQDLKEVSKKIKEGYWEPGSDLAYVDGTYDVWHFVVDEKLFQKAINELL